MEKNESDGKNVDDEIAKALSKPIKITQSERIKTRLDEDMDENKPKGPNVDDEIAQALTRPIQITPSERQKMVGKLRRIRVVKDDANKKVSEFWRSKKSKTKIGLASLFCIICLSIYIIYISGIVVYNILLFEFDMEDFIYYFIILILGIGAFIGGLKLAKNIILFEYVMDSTFEEEIYFRLEPALREVANVQVDLDDVKLKMDRLNLHINRLETNPPFHLDPVKSIESKIVSFLRYVLLINLTLGILIFMMLYPSEYTPYVLTLLFPIWWVAITSEYKLWKVDEAYGWVLLPILVVPISIIVLDVLILYGSLLGLIGAALVLYVLSYRTWSRFYVEGRRPMDVINNIANNHDSGNIIRKRALKRK
jgi:hypothetical protein